jgi:hypothetical protein
VRNEHETKCREQSTHRARFSINVTSRPRPKSTGILDSSLYISLLQRRCGLLSGNLSFNCVVLNDTVITASMGETITEYNNITKLDLSLSLSKMAQSIVMLDSGWQFMETDGSHVPNWLPVGKIPTNIHIDLMDNAM